MRCLRGWFDSRIVLQNERKYELCWVPNTIAINTNRNAKTSKAMLQSKHGNVQSMLGGYNGRNIL